MNTALKPLQKSAMQVRIRPAGMSTFLHAVAITGPDLESALKHRPTGWAKEPEAAGLRTHLANLRKAIDAALSDPS